jgi:toxin ParE1/3/4
MARIRWTDQSLDDIESICEYIARDSRHYAHLFANQIFEKAKMLKDIPFLGKVVLETNQNDIRQIIHGNYRIFYRIKSEEIQILTVYHGARILNPDFLKGLEE